MKNASCQKKKIMTIENVKKSKMKRLRSKIIVSRLIELKEWMKGRNRERRDTKFSKEDRRKNGKKHKRKIRQERYQEKE